LKINLPVAIKSIIPNRLAVKLRPTAERKIRHQSHPWVFDESIVKQNKDAKTGDLAIVFDQKKDKFLACGLYDPNSPIRIRLLQFYNPSKIDQQWFEDKISHAFNIRQPLLKSDTNAYRLLFGENDGLPGLICDVYDKIAVVKLYSGIWFPYLETVLPAIIRQSGVATVVMRLSRNISNMANSMGLYDGDVVYGKLNNENIVIKEHGIKFKVNVVKGHKTGFFLDHRHNRLAIGKLSKAKEVLDIFSYAGGFSVHALVGGAKSVTSLDISKQALELAAENVQLNGDHKNHQTICGNAFEVLDQLEKQKKRFDIVIIDPPALAKKAREIEKALERYYKLAKLGSQLITKEGTLILASCSSRVSADDFFEVNQSALEKTGLILTKKTFHDLDHPIGFAEGAYLKCGYYSQAE